MGLECSQLIRALMRYRLDNPRGMSQLSRESGVPHNTLSRLSRGVQTSIEFKTWNKLHKYDSDLFPPPIVERENRKESGIEDLIDDYPIIEKLIFEARDAQSCGVSEYDMINILLSYLEYEKQKARSSGRGTRK